MAAPVGTYPAGVVPVCVDVAEGTFPAEVASVCDGAAVMETGTLPDAVKDVCDGAAVVEAEAGDVLDAGVGVVVFGAQ